MVNCLVVGLQSPVMTEVAKLVTVKDVQIFVATNLAGVKEVFSKHVVHTLIMGGGLPLADRLEVARYAFEHSEQTSVHMKERATGPEGFVPFINGVLSGLVDYNKFDNA